LTQALAREIVKEHDDIIDSLRSSRGSDDDIADATAALRKHMFQAMLRSNFDETMIDMAIKQQNERLTWYTKYAQTP
jgi:hypothetical protein